MSIVQLYHNKSWSTVQIILTYKNHSYEYWKEQNLLYGWRESWNALTFLKEQMISNQSKFIEIDGEQLLDNQDVLQLFENKLKGHYNGTKYR